MSKYVIYKIHNCKECPNRTTERTIGAGYAFDWLCKAKNNKKIAEYIEWTSEEPKEIPDWCPLR
jgi:hypothetical protein